VKTICRTGKHVTKPIGAVAPARERTPTAQLESWPSQLRLLLIDESPETEQSLLQALQRAGIEASVRRVDSEPELRAALPQQCWDAVICDFQQPGIAGLDALAMVRGADPDMPFILLSAPVSAESAVAAIKAGASDLIGKRTLAQLAPALQRALNETQVRAAQRLWLRDLTQREQRFRALIALSSDWYWEQDQNFRFTLVAPAVQDRFSEAFEDWAGKTPWELPYRNVDWATHLATLNAHRPFHDLELQPITNDGSVVYVSVSGEPRFGSDGEFLGYRGIGKDITQRMRGIDDLQRFQAVDAISDAIFLIDRASMRVIHVNDAGCRLRELSREQILELDSSEVWNELSGSRAELEPIYDRLIAAGGVSDPQEFLWRAEEGARQWLDVRRHAYRLRGRWTIMVLVRDITERKEAEEKLRRLNRLYAMVSNINALVVRARDQDELLRNACRIAVEHGEFARAWVGIVDQAGDHIVPMAFAGLDEKSIAAIKKLFASAAGALPGPSLTAIAIRDKTAVVSNDLRTEQSVLLDGLYVALGSYSRAILPLLVADKAIGVLVLHTGKAEFFDEQGLKLLTDLAGNIAHAVDYIDKQARLDYLAYYDALTGLANRRLFLERLAQYVRDADKHKTALFLIDLERFKSVNDSLGRAAGDSLLRQVAQWLTSYAGDASLLARVGADQFAIVLPQVNEHGDLVGLLEKAVQAFLVHPFNLNESVYRIAGKVGVVLYPDDGSDADTLFKHAEAALKKAKVSGDRYLFYAQRMSETLSGRLGLENQLRQALEREEFVLHYQPKINLVSGELTGAEALIRWNNPHTGLVAPGRFIPILEQTGLIQEVGRWALRTAIAQYLRWLADDLPAVPIAVNVSPLQLRHRGFVDEIAQAISVDARAAAGLELEITESLIMEDVSRSIISLNAIRAMGISIAIDDFGTGFSSLSYLSRLPMDTLKIDRSFVYDMASGPAATTLVSVIINLAHALKLKAVAEGVETAEQLRLLRSLDCDEMQGYLFGRPVSGEIFESRYLSSLRPDTSRTPV
jgi:diguanylate cyclase (GGDEF)-like protein/PAS domain S-box-containing protein